MVQQTGSWLAPKHIRNCIVAQSSIGKLLGMNTRLLGQPHMFVVFMESPILLNIFKNHNSSHFSSFGLCIV